MPGIYTHSKVETDRRNLNPKDAPIGFSAVLKFSVDNGKNFCWSCDYHKECMTKSFPCQDFKREDSCSVVFKKDS